MTRFIEKLKVFPYHIAGLPLFFISHGYSEYTWLIPVTGLLLLLAGLLAGSFLLWFILRKSLFPSGIKAGLAATGFLAVLLFYAVLQEFFKNSGFLSWFSRYRYLLPAVGIAIVLLFLYLKRSRHNFLRTTLYLNILFIVLVAVDTGVIATNLLTTRIQPVAAKIDTNTFLLPDSVKKPDIYFIILDGYSGSAALKSHFNYDNSRFENTLHSRGFFVAATAASNYPSTVLSMTSIFTMDTVYWLKGRGRVQARDYSVAQTVIQNSEVPRFLQSIGYRLYNFSLFDIDREPAFVSFGFIPVKLQLLTLKTLPGRIIKDMGWDALVAGNDDGLAQYYREDLRKSIQRMLSATRNVARESPGEPKFIYTHFMMPHIPYLYDSTGREIRIDYSNLGAMPEQQFDNAYLQYLVYASNMVSGLVKDIQEATKGNAVIMIMSDHGYRGMPGEKRPVPWMNNLNAVYIPGKDYRLFYDSVSNVNQFRILFNTLFKTGLPLLPDNMRFSYF